MYKYINNTLSIPARILYDELQLISYTNYKLQCHRGKLIRTACGKGKGNEAYVSFDDLPNDLQAEIKNFLGYGPEKTHFIVFEEYIIKDAQALQFFQEFTLENGEPLPEKNIKEYCTNAEILNAIKSILNSTSNKRKALGSKVKPWPKLTEIINSLPFHKYPHGLPKSEKRLIGKYNQYLQDGYSALIHSGFGHKNAERLGDEAKSWVLARWADQVKKCTGYNQLLREYNDMAIQQDWKPLKSEQSLINYLTHPQIEPLWYARRFGELRAKEKFGFQHKTSLPSLRDSLWYADGTKLNYYYQDENGKMQTCQVYEVIDTYSEVFLGFHISKTEDFEAQYQAFKMAIQIAAHKPYEIKFDNQGGTKKLEAQSFLTKIARLTTRTAPYNGKSKTIESAFGRFQQQYLKQDWFFTGMNITAKALESKANMEMILANKKSLPTLEDIKQTYAQRRKEWNEAPHPKTGKPRLEMYLNSHNPTTPEIQIWDMIDMFWITREKEVTATAWGIKFTHKNVDYDYVVMDADRMTDLDWLANNIDKKFVVKYDPDDMTMIWLYENTPLGLKRVTAAETKPTIHRNRQEQEEWEASYIKQIELRLKEKRIDRSNEINTHLERWNRTNADYGLVEPKILGVNSKRKKKKPTEIVDTFENETPEIDSIGQFEKQTSNIVLKDEYQYM